MLGAEDDCTTKGDTETQHKTHPLDELSQGHAEEALLLFLQKRRQPLEDVSSGMGR